MRKTLESGHETMLVGCHMPRLYGTWHIVDLCFDSLVTSRLQVWNIICGLALNHIDI